MTNYVKIKEFSQNLTFFYYYKFNGLSFQLIQYNLFNVCLFFMTATPVF